MRNLVKRSRFTGYKGMDRIGREAKKETVNTTTFYADQLDRFEKEKAFAKIDFLNGKIVEIKQFYVEMGGKLQPLSASKLNRLQSVDNIENMIDSIDVEDENGNRDNYKFSDKIQILDFQKQTVIVKKTKQPAMNLLIGDNFFNQNPSKVLGTQTIKKGRFGSDMIVVEGSISNLQQIDAEPVKVVDLYPEQVLTTETSQEIIEKVFETEEKATTVKKVEQRRTKAPMHVHADGTDIYSFAEIDELYNKNISRDEKEAYYFTHPELNYKLLFDRYENDKDDLVAKKLICWDPAEKKFVYVYTYQSGNIGRKVSELKQAKEKIIAQFGEKQFDIQTELLAAVMPKQKGLVGDERLIILPHSNFSKQFKINELRFGKPEFHHETSLFYAFRQWLYQLTADNFNKTTSREIIEYYLDNKSLAVSKNSSKEQQVKDEKNAINIRQRTKEEGDQLFARFLSDELTPEDQAKLQYLWNEKFNSYAEPNLSKMPVCFKISKKFKQGPLLLNPTQRQAAAFQTEKFSALLAYGVGVGKTLASIVCFSQAYYNGYAKKGIFVVPTNTYPKWLGEIQGYKDEISGEWMHGALPQLPPIVGLFNLNPTLVKNTLKDYSKKDELHLERIMEAIGKLKQIDKPVPTLVQQKAISNIYPVNWLGMQSGYDEYVATTKAAKPKTLTEFTVDYLKDEYNYFVYSLGTIKKFPDGTIFVTTEVGLQRLGVGEDNKYELSSRLFRILSQGENAGDKEDKRDIAGLSLKIEQTISNSMKNAKLLVEDLGIDWGCFDEAHYYKKLFTFVKGTVTGEEEKFNRDTREYEKKVKRDKSKYELKSGSYPSGRALSAFVLSHFIQSKNDNRNVIQLTATPFTNSPLEVYSMLALTNFKTLEDLGLDNMVDFFDTFMKINYDIKYTPQKTVVKDVVLTGYNNLPQLRQVIYSLMDKKDEGASLKRPVKDIWPSIQKGIETTLPMTMEQEELMQEVKKYINGKAEYELICAAALQEEIDNLDFDGITDEALIAEWELATLKDYDGERENLPDAKREALIKQIKSQKSGGMEMAEGELDEAESLGVRILKGLSMMKQITLSPYLYHKACRKAAGDAPVLPDYKDYVNSSPKFKYTMGCIKSAMDWHKKNNTKASGHVIYMNAGVEYFPLLKKYLVKEIGLKESQVGIVSGSMTKNAKESVKNGFLRGDILVLIGSSTISVGVDLQNNASTLYNLYYDWNPTDAAQIEGRIWRQGNRFASVRIVYPQCYNSADPVIFEYLNSKTLRINEIWNRSSEVQELDLRDFNPKELQKKLITDPEEKADWEVLEEIDKIQGEIIFAENRRETLQNAMYAFRDANDYRPKVKDWLTKLSTQKLVFARQEALNNLQERIEELEEKYKDDDEKAFKEIKKLKAGRYDYKNDPEGKYKAPDYSTATDEVLYNDAKKFSEMVDDWDYKNANWGTLYNDRYDIGIDFKKFRASYRDMMAANERVLKPMGLSFETAKNPIAEFDAKLVALKTREEEIEQTRPARVEKFRAEAAANAHTIKTVKDRIDEFAAANDKFLGPQLVINDTSSDDVQKPAKNEIIVPKAEEKLKQAEKVEKPVTIKSAKEFEEIPSIPVAETPVVPVVQPAIAGKEMIEKQIKALSTAAKYASAEDKTRIEKQINALNIALKYAA